MASSASLAFMPGSFFKSSRGSEDHVPKMIDLLFDEWYFSFVLLPEVRTVEPRPWSNTGLLAQMQFPPPC